MAFTISDTRKQEGESIGDEGENKLGMIVASEVFWRQWTTMDGRQPRFHD